jgi:hypothetical protein
MLKVYHNLSTGLEFINNSNREINIIRIQSTLLEQSHYDNIIKELDYKFLLDLAVGNEVLIIDGSVSIVSRAIWQGVPWITYVLRRMWLKEFPQDITVKNYNMTKYFSERFKELSKDSKNKIRYTRKYLNTTKINLITQPLLCELDGKDKGVYKANLIKALTKSQNIDKELYEY